MQMNLSPGDTIGKYIVKEFLGAGVFGRVYLMHDNLLNRDTAVKFIENQNPTSFVAHFEAQILHQCRNDRIVSVNSVDVVQDASGRYYAAIDMEFVDGGSAQKLIESGYVTIRKAIKILIDILFAIEHAHRQGILHRDAKPANFLLQGNRAKLSDFGLATTAAASLTASGAGSPVYCAPEVVNDDKTSVQTDLFAAGMSLFQLANNITNLGAKITSIDTIKMGRTIATIGYQAYVPRRLRYICNKACAPDPARRYSNASEMRQALERLRVVQDWERVTAEFWQARINNQDHHMTIEQGAQLEMVYRINGRRRNANCKVATNLSDAAMASENWVYKNTF
jgi:serine/threonine-protein kinase